MDVLWKALLVFIVLIIVIPFLLRIYTRIVCETIYKEKEKFILSLTQLPPEERNQYNAEKQK